MVFIVHSLGGLVCKDALLLSRNSADYHLRDLLNSTFAIAFMGTLHSGSALAKWAKIPAKYLGVLKSSTTNLLSVLESDSDVLRRIQDDFLEMVRARSMLQHGIEIRCFYEALPMKGIETVVARESAVLSGFNSISIRENHLVRLKSAADSGFRFVVREISRWRNALAEARFMSITKALQSPLTEETILATPVHELSQRLLSFWEGKQSMLLDNEIQPAILNGSPLDLKDRIVVNSLLAFPSETGAPPTSISWTIPARAPTQESRSGSSNSGKGSSVGPFKRTTIRGTSRSDQGQESPLNSLKFGERQAAPSDSLGLTLLFEPTEVEIDLIFIHGLGGGSLRTWTHPSSGICWPMNCLPYEEGFGQCRIHSSGYDSEWRIMEVETTTGLADFSLDLLTTFVFSPALRQYPETPIIFVCHSMGGLVVKQAYCRGQGEPQYQQIVSRISGMLFLSTPHRGSNIASHLNKILRVGSGMRSRTYIDDISLNSVTIQDTNNVFPLHAPKLSIFSFYEVKLTIMGLSKSLLVDRNSAVMNLPNEGQGPLYADHFGMSKFSSRRDANYVAVRNVLVAMIAAHSSVAKPAALIESPVEITSTNPQNSLFNDEVKRIQMLLGIPEDHRCGNYAEEKEGQETACSRWILSHPSFQAWSKDVGDCARPVFVLYGKLGGGKSFLASEVVRNMELYQGDSRYFVFLENHPIRSLASTCLKVLASQIAQVNPEVRRRVAAILNHCLIFQSDDANEIWHKLFLDIILNNEAWRNPFYFIIDGIESCEEGHWLLTRLLSPKVSPKLRIFLTIRAPVASEIKIVLERVEHRMTSLEICPTASNTDTEVYCFQQISKLDWLEVDISENLRCAILRRSCECFRWMKWIFQTLQTAYTSRRIWEILDTIPPAMVSSYRKALTSSSERRGEKKLLSCALAWIVCTTEPQTVAELQTKLTNEMGERVFGLRRFIETFCADFLFVDSDDRILFVHETARKFLIDSADSDLLDWK